MATTGQKLLAAGPTLAAAEIGFAMAHTGFIGAVVAAGIAAVVYVTVEETMSGENENSSPDDSQDAIDTADQQQHKADSITDKTPSLLYRLFNGKSAREATATNEYNEDSNVGTEPLDEQQDKKHEQAVFPQYPQNERLSLGYLTNVGKLARFDPHMDMLLGKGLIVAGVQGMGKSNIAALVQESASHCDMPTVMFDLKREFHTIVDVAPNAIRAGHESLQGSIPGYFVLSAENADEFAHMVMTGKHQAIIDLQSYGRNLTDAANIITAVLNSFLAWAKAQGEDNCIPCLMMLDEAQMFLPQNPQLSILSANTINTLQAAFFEMCNMGRTLGYTMCFFTQSIANMQKWAIRNCQRKIVGIHVEKNDLDRCEEEVDEDVATREKIKTLPEGVGVVIGFTPTQQLVKFDKRISRHVSNTPSIARLRQPLKEQRVITPSSVQPSNTPHTSSTVAITERQTQQKDVAPLPQPIIPEKDNRPKANDIDLAEAIEAYNNGATNRRKLADKFGMSETQGANLLKRIEEARTLA